MARQRTALAALLLALVALLCTLAPAHAQKEDVRPSLFHSLCT